MNKNIIKLIAILVMCFILGAVLVSCSESEPVVGPTGPAGPTGPQGPEGPEGKPGANLDDCDDEDHVWVAEVWSEHANGDEGLLIEICSECGDARFTVDPHVPTDEGTVVPATCDTDGYTEHLCKTCGYTYRINPVEKLGHKPAVPFDENNIDECWTKIDAAPGEFPCTSAEKYTTDCVNEGCDEKVEATATLAPHTWDDGHDAFLHCECTEAPYKVYECTVCGELKDEITGDAKGHEFNEWKVVDGEQATATLDGRIIKTCKNGCGCADCVFTENVPALVIANYSDEANTRLVYEHVAPKCTEDGAHNFYVVAQDGAKVFVGTIADPFQGHTYVRDGASKFDITTVPTATEKGAATVYCLDCDHKVENVELGVLGSAVESCDHAHLLDKYSYTLEIETGKNAIVVVELECNDPHHYVSGVTKVYEGFDDKTQTKFYYYLCEVCGKYVTIPEDQI